MPIITWYSVSAGIAGRPVIATTVEVSLLQETLEKRVPPTRTEHEESDDSEPTAVGFSIKSDPPEGMGFIVVIVIVYSAVDEMP